jgi:uncharacterized protein YwgA
MSDTRRKLASFVHHLGEEVDWRFDLNDFYDRIRMQKYVKLAEAFGFDHPYEYGLYIHGPYSPSLANDYYSDPFKRWHKGDPPELTDFDAEAFGELVNDKDHGWLEVAATIKFLDDSLGRSNGPTMESVLDRMTELKNVSRPAAREIYLTLEESGVLSRRG